MARNKAVVDLFFNYRTGDRLRTKPDIVGKATATLMLLFTDGC